MLKTLDNALNILTYFTKNKPSWGVRELAKESGVNHTVVYRMLATFEQHGFLIQDEATQKYSFGFKMLEYGSIVRGCFGVDTVINPIMSKIAEQTGESVIFSVCDGLYGLLIEVVDSVNPVKLVNFIGGRTPLCLGASNKIMMAYLPYEEQSNILDHFITDAYLNRIDKAKVFDELQSIKQQGWSYTTDEGTEGSFGLATPIFNTKKEITAAISIVGPKYRMPKENIDTVLNELIQGRDQIQNFLLVHHLDISLKGLN